MPMIQDLTVFSCSGMRLDLFLILTNFNLLASIWFSCRQGNDGGSRGQHGTVGSYVATSFICNLLIPQPAERLALTWVQKYIEEFCGDKSKVML